MANEPRVHHRIAVVSDSNSSNIKNAHIVAGPLDVLHFSSIGSGTIISFTDPDIFNPPIGQITLTDGGPARKLTIKQQAVPGIHPFTAYCRTHRRFAAGGSDGEIIIQT